MNPAEYHNIVTYKLKGVYPSSLTKKEKFLLRRKASVYDIEGEELFYWRHKGTTRSIKTKVVCGSEDAKRIFQDFHASAVGAHCGQTKTRDAVSKRFYWLGMSVDITKWVSQCLACQASTPSIKKPSALTPIKVSEPFELVGMDLIGKLTTTTKGNQYICVKVDYYFTKWPQAYAIKSKSAKEVTECLMKFVFQFGAPKRILTDQGREFVYSINKEVCTTLGIQRSLCSPYHPQTNGLERMNWTIQRALSKVVASNPKEWDEFLDPVMFGLQTKKQVTTKYSPYYLMFGREARYPSEIPEQVQIDSSVEDAVAVEELSQDIEGQTRLFEKVRQHLAKGHDDTKNKIKPENVVFKVGVKVWRQNVRSQQRKGGKLEANYIGPYIIKAIQGKSADLQDDKGAIFHKINSDHLRLTVESTPRVPQSCLKPSQPVATIPAAPTQPPSAPPQPPPVAAPTQPPSAPPQPPPVAAPTRPPSAPEPTAPPQPPPVAAPTEPPSAPEPTAPPQPPPVAAPTQPPSAPEPTAPPQPPPVAAPTQPPSAPPQPPTIAAQTQPHSAPPQPPPVAAPTQPPSAPPQPPPVAAPTQPPSAPPQPPPVAAPTQPPSAPPQPPPVAAPTQPPSAPEPTAPPQPPPVAAPTQPPSAPPQPPPVAAPTQPPSAPPQPPAVAAQTQPPSAPPQPPPVAAQTQPPSAPEPTAPPQPPPVAAPTQPPSDLKYTKVIAEKYVRDAWAGNATHVLLSKIGAYKLFYWDIHQLGPNMELESECINAYMSIMVRDHNCHNTDKAAFIDTYAMTAMWQGKSRRLKHPIQGDITSCGVFALKFAEKLLKKDTVDFQTTPMAINDHRLEIALKLLLQTDDLEDLCCYCGEKEHKTDFNWIQCDVCLRWFHQMCMGSPPPEQSFVCPACV